MGQGKWRMAAAENGGVAGGAAGIGNEAGNALLFEMHGPAGIKSLTSKRCLRADWFRGLIRCFGRPNYCGCAQPLAACLACVRANRRRRFRRIVVRACRFATRAPIRR